MHQATASTATRLTACHSERWRRVRRSLRAAMQHSDEETIHRLRLDIKKLLALYDLAGHCHYRPGSHRDQRPLIRLFRRLGAIRDHSNAVAMCLQFKIDPATFAMSDMERERQMIRFRTQAVRHEEDLRRLHRRATRQIAQAEEGQWESYIREKRQEVQRLLRTAASPTGLHAARKAIKQLLYNASLPGAPQGAISAAELAWLDAMQEQIGLWHDVEVFGERLREMGYDGRQPARYEAVLRRARILHRGIAQGIKKAQL